jgi:type I restriction enzyme S subunit
MSYSKLPEGWCITSLENIAEWGSGGTPSRKEAAYYGGDVPWIKTGDLGPRILLEASEFITDLGVKNSSAKLFSKGSVAIAMYGATIGKTSILGLDATTNQACGVGKPIDGVTFSEFLYYFLLNEKDNFIAKGKGGAQPNISQALIKEHQIALPPLAEQKVIADKLDTLLAQVETTKARLERIPEIIKRFRQSVLAAAVSGRLTEEWRGENKSTWESVTLGDLAEFVTSGSRGWAKYYADQGSVFIRSQDINTDDLELLEPCYVNLPESTEGTRTKVKEGDILVTITGANVTKCARVKYALDDAYVSQHVALIRLIRPSNAPFVELALKSIQAGRKQLTNMAYGGGKPGLNLQNIKDVFFEIPAENEQTEIVRRVEQLFAFADTIEQKANAALERVNNLTQSILAKAFRGELTAEWRAANPDLISGENSAEALLKRIKAERAENVGRKRR